MFKIIEEGGQKRVFCIGESGIRIGRDPAKCTINLPVDSPGVSRIHALLELRGRDLVLVDQSAFGTVICGETIIKSSRVLRDTDEFIVGEHTFHVDIKQKEPTKSTPADLSTRARKHKITAYFQKPTQHASQLEFGDTIADETQRSSIMEQPTSYSNSHRAFPPPLATSTQKSLRSKLLGDGITQNIEDSDGSDENAEISWRTNSSVNDSLIKNRRDTTQNNRNSTAVSSISNETDIVSSGSIQSSRTQRSGRPIANVFSRAEMRANNMRKKSNYMDNVLNAKDEHNLLRSTNDTIEQKNHRGLARLDAVVMPMDINEPMVSTSQAPTHDVRTLDEAFEAVSPKKRRDASPPRKSSPTRKKMRLEKGAAKDTELVTSSIQPVPPTKRKQPRKIGDLDDVRKELECLSAQLCSGKKIDDESSSDEETIEKIKARELREAAKVREKMNQIVCYEDLTRPSQCPSSNNNTTTSSEGLCNYKRFRKAQQGRFNQSIQRNLSAAGRKLPPPRLGASDLIDFRKIRPGESYE